LRQKRQKEDGDLGVGDVHDDTTTIKLPAIDFSIRFALNLFSGGPERFPGEIDEVAGADKFQRCKGDGRRLENNRDSQSDRHAVNDQSRA